MTTFAFTIGRSHYKIDKATQPSRATTFSLWHIRDGSRGRIPEITCHSIEDVCMYLTTVEHATGDTIRGIVLRAETQEEPV